MPINKIMQQVIALEMETLARLKGPIQEVLVRNVGTQYFSLANLKQIGHPYRIGGPGRPGGLPAGVVNRQSGEFFQSLIIRGPIPLSGDRIALMVYSRGEKPLGNWLLSGTNRMKGRPWTKHLRTEILKVTAPIIAGMGKRLRLRVKV